jgi:ATP-dependent Lhr-like helicase
VLTKGAVAAESIPGGFAMLYKVLSAFEDAGRCQRGYFVESLGGAQFAVASTVDRLRSYLDGVDPERREYHAVVLAAADPANPYGAALPWPSRKDGDDGGDEASHRPGRKAGALVALVDGELTWFLERGGRSLLSFTDDAEAHAAAATALAELVSAGRVQSLLVEKVNGASVLEPGGAGQRVAVQDALVSAGFSRTPRGLRLR